MVIQVIQRVLNVLVVEDEARYRSFLLEVLRDMNCNPAGAATAGEAMRLIESGPPDVLLLDLNLPIVDGLTFLERFRERHVETPVVIITGFGDLKSAQRAIRFGVVEFLTKPCHLGQIEQALDHVRRQLARGGAMMMDDPPREEPAYEEPAPREDVRPLATIEREAIIEALRMNGGNRSAAALKLGISRRALYNKIGEYKRAGHVVP